MSNYIPRTRKKREIQQKREDHLRRLVARGVPRDRLARAAEEVRAARIRTVRALRQHCWAPGSTAPYDRQIAALEELPVESILAKFGARLDDTFDPGGAGPGDADPTTS